MKNATAWDHTIIDQVSVGLEGMCGDQEASERLRKIIKSSDPEQREKTLAEIAIAFIRWSQDLKEQRKSVELKAEDTEKQLNTLRDKVEKFNTENLPQFIEYQQMAALCVSQIRTVHNVVHHYSKLTKEEVIDQVDTLLEDVDRWISDPKSRNDQFVAGQKLAALVSGIK